MSDYTCPHCGATQSIEPDSAPVWGLHETHVFKRYHGPDIETIVGAWNRDIASVEDISLCPVRVYAEKMQLRSVGPMLHGQLTPQGPLVPYDPGAVNRFIADCNADPDIPRLIREDFLRWQAEGST